MSELSNREFELAKIEGTKFEYLVKRGLGIDEKIRIDEEALVDPENLAIIQDVYPPEVFEVLAQQLTDQIRNIKKRLGTAVITGQITRAMINVKTHDIQIRCDSSTPDGSPVFIEVPFWCLEPLE